jgi:hypothetical protein
MLARLLQRIDFVGSSLSFTHNGSKRLNNPFGGIFTILIGIFSIYCVIYFGEDIIKKEKPISTFSKAYTTSSKIYQNNTPIMMQFGNSYGQIYTDVDRYISIEGKRFTAENGVYDFQFLAMEPCNVDKHFDGHRQLYLDNNLDLSHAYCLNLKQITYLNDTTLQRDDIYYENEYGGGN